MWDAGSKGFGFRIKYGLGAPQVKGPAGLAFRMSIRLSGSIGLGSKI